MGKRRTNVPHKDRYNESDSDDNEEQVEETPLDDKQVAEIKARPKLVAKRRAPASDSTPSLGPSPFSFMGKPADNSSEDKPAQSVFTGFKGFSAFKPSVPVPTSATAKTSETTQPFSLFDKKETESKTDSNLTNGSSKPTSEAATPSLSFLTAQPKSTPSFFAKSNGEQKKDQEDEIIEIKKSDETKSQNKTISESELNFINELNSLFERCYGSNKRVYKLPLESLTENTVGEDKETKYACLLAELNKHCSKWISKHVEESPLVILTPVFVDYFNYLILLEKHFFPDSFKKTDKNPEPAQKTPSFSFSSTITNGTKLPVNGTNGHKEINIEKKIEIDDKTKENKDAEPAKMPILTFKTSNEPLAPISFGNTNKIDSFKFGSTLSTEKSIFSKEITENKTIELEKSSTQIQLPKITTSFVEVSKEKIPEESKKESESTAPKSFFAPFTSTTTSSTSIFKFGSTTSAPSSIQTIQKPEESAKTPSETPVEESKKFSFTPTPGGFFSNLKKKEDEPTPLDTQEKPTETVTNSLFKSTASNSTTFSFLTSTPMTAPSASSTITESTKSSFFSFGTNATIKPGGLFGSGGFGSTPSPFGTTTSTPTPFGTSAPSAAGGEGEGEEEPYEPPKPESSDVKEEGAIYEKRMKLYYFSDKETKFVDRGIGNLFLKPTKDGESTQLIIRADTKLANILLNVKLSKVFPITKAGPKDVSYLCVPNPPIPGVSDSVPCKFLFKVKTEDDANELLDKLNEYKK
ncbi:unnamed protein product [Brachionus calyciflorus]|uniref:RanBD1 domain-containing protein n=1 Tax=Brachionus calyciflorus TaxID=104777 RepID=A0A813VL45_9BILA|nr:unnamed protein product [Brachionus calyciflorus]